MNSANSQSKTTYTVTLIVAPGVEITGKEVFYTLEDARDSIGREVVGDDGTITVKGIYRINTHTA